MAGFPKVGDDYGRYRVERLLGRGGMGVVYQALDTTLARPVALKVVLPHLGDDEEFRRRFEREATVLARIRSRHIVHILDHGEQDGCLYLVTDFFPDGDLHTWLTTHGPMAPDLALRLLEQLCEGLADAHEVGVVHRDVKPSNVLLWARSDGRLIPYLCDFGIATDGDAGFTRTGAIVGSPAYMAPERHLGQPATAAGDVYSLGCVLWACLTGKPPFSGTDYQLMTAHLHDPIPQLEDDGPLAQRLNDILNSTLAKHPTDRPIDLSSLTEPLGTPERTVLRQPVPDEPQPVAPLVVQEPEEDRRADDTLDRPDPTLSGRTQRVLPPARRPPQARRPGSPKRAVRRNRRRIIASSAILILALIGTAIYAYPRFHDDRRGTIHTDPSRCWNKAAFSTGCTVPSGGVGLHNTFIRLPLKQATPGAATVRGSALTDDCRIREVEPGSIGAAGIGARSPTVHPAALCVVDIDSISKVRVLVSATNGECVSGTAEVRELKSDWVVKGETVGTLCLDCPTSQDAQSCTINAFYADAPMWVCIVVPKPWTLDQSIPLLNALDLPSAQTLRYYRYLS